MSLLVVEDNPLILLLAQQFLEEVGYDVVTADDGPAVLRLIENLPSLDGLIIDFMLPTMNGAEIVERVRPVYPTVPMIMASAFPDAVTELWLRQYEVEFLMKPYTGRRLVDAVRRFPRKTAISEGQELKEELSLVENHRPVALSSTNPDWLLGINF